LAFKSNFPKQQFPDNNYKLISITDNNTYDLSYLDTILKEKQVVMLGESAHGIEEYSLVKYRIIKHLHEKLNFNERQSEFQGIIRERDCPSLADRIKYKINELYKRK
jgi:hypothetical protein